MACFEDKIATKCIKCKKVLSSGGVTFRGEPWHKVRGAAMRMLMLMIMIMIPHPRSVLCVPDVRCS